jgi:hypothetical protein
MGVFKEHAHAFENIQKRQSQIFDDACDYGVAYNTNNPPKDINELIHYVNDLKGTTLMKSRETYGKGKLMGVNIVIRIGWEIDEGMERGTEYRIGFHPISGNSRFDKTANAMICVDSESYSTPAK